MRLLIFEDDNWLDFAPLTLSRPVFLLRAGLGTLLDRQVRLLAPSQVTLWVRPGLAEIARQAASSMAVPVSVNAPLDNEPFLPCNARALPTGDENLPDALFRSPGLSPNDFRHKSPPWLAVADSPLVAPETPRYPWDLLDQTPRLITEDARQLSEVSGHPPGAYHRINPSAVFFLGRVKVGPGAVFDATGGPVVIEDEADIGANSVLEGPCCIGQRTIIAPLTYIRPGTSIGPQCRIGGEVARSIFLGQSNKVHHGYVGSSYVGQWVNLGAGTTTSNLKNTFGEITLNIGPRKIEIRRQFLGSLIGDHSKTAIGTRLMTGTYIGFCSQLAASGLPPRFIPSFAFLTDRGMEKFHEAKIRQVISRVYARMDHHAEAEHGDALLQFAREAAAVAEGDGDRSVTHGI